MSSLRGTGRTWYLLRNSFDRDEDIIMRRIEEGAEKCLLRDLRLEEETSVKKMMRNQCSHPEIRVTMSSRSRPHPHSEPTIHLDFSTSSTYNLHHDMHNSLFQLVTVRTDQDFASF